MAFPLAVCQQPLGCPVWRSPHQQPGPALGMRCGRRLPYERAWSQLHKGSLPTLRHLTEPFVIPRRYLTFCKPEFVYILERDAVSPFVSQSAGLGPGLQVRALRAAGSSNSRPSRTAPPRQPAWQVGCGFCFQRVQSSPFLFKQLGRFVF